MKNFKFKPCDESSGYVEAFLHTPLSEKNPRMRPSMVVCTGGGYKSLSPRCTEPVAFQYFSKGYNVFILYYSINDEAKNLAPLKEISLTVSKIRENSAEWTCASDKIALCGFSAGGHLVSSLATLWNNEILLESLGARSKDNKPNAIVSSYAVIKSDFFEDNLPFMQIDGMTLNQVKDFYSLDKSVSENNCPAFVWHCLDDPIVPVEHSIDFLKALKNNHVYTQAVFFPTGKHAGGLFINEIDTKNEISAQWFDMSVKFLNKIFDFEY